MRSGEMLRMHSKDQSKEKRCEVIVKGITYVVILHRDNVDGGYWVECLPPHSPATLRKVTQLKRL